jgi:hypothetical protein
MNDDVISEGMPTSATATTQTGPTIVAAVASGEGQSVTPADQLELLMRRAAELPEEAQIEVVQFIEKLEEKHRGAR